MKLQLFTTAGCHLCELALHELGLLYHQLPPLECVDIAEQASLIERYGLLIPVLKRTDSDQELCWPFGKVDIVAFIQSKT